MKYEPIDRQELFNRINDKLKVHRLF